MRIAAAYTAHGPRRGCSCSADRVPVQRGTRALPVFNAGYFRPATIRTASQSATVSGVRPCGLGAPSVSCGRTEAFGRGYQRLHARYNRQIPALLLPGRPFRGLFVAGYVSGADLHCRLVYCSAGPSPACRLVSPRWPLSAQCSVSMARCAKQAFQLSISARLLRTDAARIACAFLQIRSRLRRQGGCKLLRQSHLQLPGTSPGCLWQQSSQFSRL